MISLFGQLHTLRTWGLRANDIYETSESDSANISIEPHSLTCAGGMDDRDFFAERIAVNIRKKLRGEF